MTERIDLDELDAAEEEDESGANYGDWLWRDDGGDPDDEPAPSGRGTEGSDRNRSRSESADEDADEADDEASDGSNAEHDPSSAPAPHVPTTGERTPAGIPADGTGGGTTTPSQSSADRSSTAQSTPRPMGSDASGPHGGGADDMTMAFTYGAVRRLERPERVFAGSTWADWIGIVGDVPAHVIQKFQRERGIDADFFNGTGTDPGERLAEIDRNSMFYADRMVVVGREGADEPIAEAADWEFVPLSEAAAKADWDLATDEERASPPAESDPDPE